MSGSGYITVSASSEERAVYIGGMPAGFTLSTGGVQIIGITEVSTDQGVKTPALNAGLKPGDVIRKANGIDVRSIADFNEILEKNKGNALTLNVKRQEEELLLTAKPMKDISSKRYKIGVLIRDSVSGVGTITYIDQKTHRFGALGHAVIGEDQKLLDSTSGEVHPCSIIGVTKGVRGKAGELRGMFLGKAIAKADKICDCGIYGQLNDNFDYSSLIESEAGQWKDVKMGNAYIYSTVNGECPKKYTVDIVKVDKNAHSNKNYVIKITDKELISQTGGIVQGMSGSPIIQNNKVIGAITHVFVNDPTRGYGIYIQTMLKE